MPSNPHKPLHDAIRNVFLPKYRRLLDGSLGSISKRELCMEAFELYPVSTTALLKHIDSFYVDTGYLLADRDEYTVPADKVKKKVKA